MMINRFPFPIDNSSSISTTLNDNTWAVISNVAQDGTGDTYWDIGDCKKINLSGTIGKESFNWGNIEVYILGFNFPNAKSTQSNNIIFGGFKLNGKDYALCDNGYGTAKTSGKSFNINHVRADTTVYNTNYGGWKGCDFRYDILGATGTAPTPYNQAKTTGTTGANATSAIFSNPPANTLLAAFPSDLRAVMKLWDRYTDYVGNSSNIKANCSTKTVDAITLLTEFEIFGTRTYANTYEKNYQNQLAYFAAGNSKIRHQLTGQAGFSTVCGWWTSSPASSNATDFCDVTSKGNVNKYSTHYSLGISPAFKI